jgi:hypothetical protein
MHIDQCPHSFTQLSSTVLPAYMKQLRSAMEKPLPASLFTVPGNGPVSIARWLARKSDFSGCYVLIENSKPIYVGISRSILARLRQHFTGKTHFDASLAYAIAQRRRPTKGKRSEVMNTPEFKKAFASAQSNLCSVQISFVQIENPLELYLFEAFAAIELGTHEWNTFRTH